MFLLAIFIRSLFTDPLTLYFWGGLMAIYAVGNFIISLKYPNSFRRKFAIASWAEPSEPNLYIREEVEMEPIEEFIEEFNNAHPEAKITLTAVVARALGAALSRTGRTYGKISFGQFVKLPSVDISVAVDIGGENIANMVLTGCNTNSISDLAAQMRASVKPLKTNKDERFNKQVSTFRLIPSFLFEGMLNVLLWLNYDLGLPLPFLHLKREGFGAAVLTNVTGWQIRDTFAPMVPPLKTVATMLMNRPVERPVVRNGQIVIRRIMYLNTTFDHRFADGSDAEHMVRALHEVLSAPQKFV